VEDSTRPGLEYADGTIDVRNHFTFTATYLVPNKKSPGQLLEGWQLNGAISFVGAFPFNAIDSTSDISGTGEDADHWTLAGSPSSFQAGNPVQLPCYGIAAGTETINGGSYAFPQSSFSKQSNCITVAPTGMPAACLSAAAAEPNSPSNVVPSGSGTAPTQVDNTALYQLYELGCYYQNGAAIVPPAQGTYGSMARDVLRGKPYRNFDMSVIKNWKFRERFTAQFRAEFFNVFNRTAYAAPSANPDSPSTFGESASVPNASNPVIGTGGPRAVQLGLKLLF
jgi:hypothetical protein